MTKSYLNTMNDQDGETKREYERYRLEVLQLEWEQAEALRRTRMVEWVKDKLREALIDYDREQAQHHSDEHTHSMAVTADTSMTDDVGDVKPTDVDEAEDHSEDLEYDGWIDDAYSAEELERAEREEEERRADH